MRIVYDEPLRPGWVVTKIRSPHLSAAFLVKGTFSLKPNEPAVAAEEPEPPTGDMHYGEDSEKSLRYASDFAPYKPNTDLLLTGACHFPQGKAGSVSTVSFRVGSWSKTLAVVGNRTLKRGRIVGPESFQEMGVTYDNAYGGAGFARNPFGVGHQEETAPDGTRVRRLPNVVYPRDVAADPDSRLEPAGFGPFPVTAPERMGKAGTYDKGWLKKNWPWLPDDFDWTYFNAAPKDQQLPNDLRGDEDLFFDNLHPIYPQYAAKLPGIRARCFLHERIDGALRFREVPLKLDTLYAEPDSEKLILVWRGHVEVRSLKLKELEHLYLATERMGDPPGSLEKHREILLSRLPQKYEYVPRAASPEKAAQEAAEQAALEEEVQSVQKGLAEMEAQVAQTQEQVKAELSAAGMNVDELFAEPPTGYVPPTEPKQVLADVAKNLEKFRADFPDCPEVAVALEGVQVPQIENEEMAEEEIDESTPWTRESVREGVLWGLDFAKEDLAGLDLSGLDLTGAKFGLARLSGAKLVKTTLARADLREAYLPGADLTEADLTEADLEEADFSEATLVRAILVRTRLRWVDFSEANLEAADLSESSGKGGGFSEANLKRACFRRAKLPAADFTEAMLAEANFREAELQGARFEEAKGPGVIMEGANLTRLHAGDAPDFTGGNFRGVQGAESFWEGAKLDGVDFSKAVLTRADFTDASLRNGLFLRTEMSKARFVDASLIGAHISQSNVCLGSFERADLTGADLRGSNFYGAEFWDALVLGAQLSQANLQGTKLA